MVHCLTLHDFYNLLFPGCIIWLSKEKKNNVSDSSKNKTSFIFFSESLKWKQNTEKSLEWLNPSNLLLDCPHYSHFDCTYTFCMNMNPKIKKKKTMIMKCVVRLYFDIIWVGNRSGTTWMVLGGTFCKNYSLYMIWLKVGTCFRIWFWVGTFFLSLTRSDKWLLGFIRC